MDKKVSTARPIIALIGFGAPLLAEIQKCDLGSVELMQFANGIKLCSFWLTNKQNILAVISESEIVGPCGLPLIEAIKNKKLPPAPFFLFVNHLDSNLRSLALGAGITDVFKFPVDIDRVSQRLNFVIKHHHDLFSFKQAPAKGVRKTERSKRIFDILFAGTALLALSPVFLLVYIIIKLESKGPAFYYSMRVGTGYRIFKFYKFRSMYVNADKRLKDLGHLNQYNADITATDRSLVTSQLLCTECSNYGKCQYSLYADDKHWCERSLKKANTENCKSAFIKIKNDPRITRIGNFIRNTSIDELPQLWNVLTGDMSIVGNRPLPLYEAEKLTTDKYVLRFAAPAGITGLWQVEKRGKGEMNEEDRLNLDNVYAANYSFKNDIKLILKTIPALFQKESV